MSNVITLVPFRKEDLSFAVEWWNDPDNFGAIGVEHAMSLEDALSKFQARPTAEPYEEWFGMWAEGLARPIGILIIAPHQPTPNVIFIGSLIVDKQYRRRGYGRCAVERLEHWVRDNYPGVRLRLGVLESFPISRAFWEACGYTYIETVETDYTYRGRRQHAHKFEKGLTPSGAGTDPG